MEKHTDVLVHGSEVQEAGGAHSVRERRPGVPVDGLRWGLEAVGEVSWEASLSCCFVAYSMPVVPTGTHAVRGRVCGVLLPVEEV